MTVIESPEVCPCCGGPMFPPFQYACKECWGNSGPDNQPRPIDFDSYVDDLVGFYEYRDRL